MYCKKCGKKLEYGDKFCSGCGTLVTPDIISPDPIEKKKETIVEKESSFKSFERDENESIGKATEANFVIEDFDWDLDGFPEKRETSEDDTLDFDWNPVLEEKHNKKEVKQKEKARKKEVSIDSFADIADILETPTREEIEHTILELGLGSTARFEKIEVEEAADKPSEEPIEADDEVTKLDDVIFNNIDLEEKVGDDESVEKIERFEETPAEDAVEPIKTFVPVEVDEDTADIEEVAEPIVEEDKEIIEAETIDEVDSDLSPIEDSIEDESVDSNESIGVDKFYTFNQKNEEFQALLDQEYERLRKRLREESEAEELLSRKHERLENARNKWAMGDLEIADTAGNLETSFNLENDSTPAEALPDKREDNKAEEGNKYLNDAIKTLKEETVEIPKDDAIQRLFDSYAEESVAESESKLDSKADENVVEIVQPAKSWVVDESTEGNEILDEEKPAVTDKTIVLPPKEQRESIKNMKAAEVVDYGDIFIEDEEEVPLTRKERRALKKAEKERAKAEKEREREEAKAERERQREEEQALEAEKEADAEKENSKEIALEESLEDIAEADDADENEVEKKSSKKGIAFLDVLIVILAIIVCAAAIMAFAPDSYLGNKIGTGVEKVKQSVGLDYKSKKTVNKVEDSGTPLSKMIKNASKENENIGVIEEGNNLAFSPSVDYGIDDVMKSVTFVDSVWHTDSDGNAVNYGDTIVKTLVKYYSDLVNKMNKGSDDVLNVLVKDTDFYKQLKDTKALGDGKFSIDSLKIGEMRSLDNKYFVIVDVSETKDGSTSELKQVVELVAQDKDMKINNVVDVK